MYSHLNTKVFFKMWGLHEAGHQDLNHLGGDKKAVLELKIVVHLDKIFRKQNNYDYVKLFSMLYILHNNHNAERSNGQSFTN